MDSLKETKHGQELMDTLSEGGKMILVELEDIAEINTCFQGRDLLCFTPNPDELRGLDGMGWVAHGIMKVVRTIQRTSKNWPHDPDGFNCVGPKMNINFLIHRIDMMDIDMSKKDRGLIRVGMLGQLSKKILKGSNVIITSSQEEYRLRDMCDLHINLRKQ